ncbi:MAG: single-stranded-DNA-specific exonuclease RecJ [Candidatus Anammoximicrobium sp.]|nr:single-stranded-DNA-specific exonuclease RecJ [Candidatus Anammoximicrobium sp.]
MERRWRIRPHDEARITALERAAGVSPVVAKLLLARGICNPQQAGIFLDAQLTGLREPDLLPGLTAAVDRLHAALQQKRRIVVYGDYDADGMTATGLLVCCLRLLGANVGYHVPNRLEEGYGLNDESLGKLASQGASVVVSVDCGIGSVAAAETARQLGLELIVTDHHELRDDGLLPAAAAIVHPRLPGSTYPFGGLCGAGVAFKLAWALCQRASEAKRVKPAMRDFLLAAIGLAAVGTVADVVPLLDENRILVRHGLVSLRQRPLPGIAALLRVTGLDRKPQLSAEDIGFTLAPRLNAAGRLGQASLGVELITTESAERALRLAEYIHELNKSRDTLERSVYLAAHKQLKEQFDPETEAALVLAGVDWHPGVIGIVAGRLAEKYHRPVVMISWDHLGIKPGIGSARSVGRLNLHQALAACSQHLLSHGGHAAAAGLKIEESKLDAFRADFCEYVSGEMSQEDRVAEVQIDAEATLGQLTLKTVEQIEQLAPFGHSNPRPILCASGVTLAGSPRRMGNGERHLAVRVRQHGVTVRGVAFGRGEVAEELASLAAPLDVAFRPVINEFNGRRSVEMHLVDWRVSRLPALAGT